jgi:hypothetical protein
VLNNNEPGPKGPMPPGKGIKKKISIYLGIIKTAELKVSISWESFIEQR